MLRWAHFVLSNMALSAQIASGRRNGQIVLLAVIEIMATPAAHTPIDEPDAAIHRKRHIELARVARSLPCIGHADRMIGHAAPPSSFLCGAFVFSGYYSGYVIVATKAVKGFRVHAADKLAAVFERTLAFVCPQVGLGRKLPVYAFSTSVSGSLMT